MVLGTGAILSLAIDVSRQVEELANANTQAVQWSMAQADVEFLAFILATHPPVGETEPDLDAVRRRHDIFYGRVKMLEDGTKKGNLTRSQEYIAGVNRLSAYIARVTPLIDAPDARLRVALPGIRALAEEVRPDLRYVTLSSQRELARVSDNRRRLATDTLQRIGGLTFLLIAALISLIVGLGVLLRRVRTNADREALAHARLRAIILASIDGILVVDEAGAIREANAAAERQFGPRAGGLLGMNVMDLIALPQADGGELRGLPPTGPRYTRIETLRHDGSRKPAECSVAEIMGDSERVRICFLHDISDRLAAEEELTRARDRALAGEKSKTDMLAVMSHEMRTPLNGILGTLDLVEETRLTGLQREYLRIVRTSGTQLLGHVNSVLDISRLDAGKMTVARQPFQIGPLLADLAESQRPMAEAQGNRVVVNLQMVGDWVEGDPQKLSQVLLNLLSNAVKFTRDGTIVLDALRHEGEDRVTFRVSDSGIGMAAADLERIFDEFVTLDSSYGRVTEGTGLGLPISRRLVQAMGGELVAESRQGHGSTFRFALDLPHSTAVPADDPRARAKETPIPSLWRPLDILVVEDNPINRFVLRAMLEGDGHDVTEAVNGAEGLQRAQERRYDLIFMDIAMPELDGTQATRQIRASGGPSADVPIIALTAHALPQDLARFMDAGLSGTLTKPLTRAQLRDTLQSMIQPETPADMPAPSLPAGAVETASSTTATVEHRTPHGPDAQAPSADAAGPATAPGSLLDMEQTETLRSGLGDEVFARLLDRYLAETEAELGVIRRGYGEAAAQDLADKAHTLAGSAAIFGAQHLRMELIGLEQALRELDDEEADEALARLDSLWPDTRSALLSLRG